MRAEAGGDGHDLSAYKLPRGRHGLDRAEVRLNQRWRLLAAAGELLAEESYVAMTTARVARRAAVSSTTFYEHFDNLDGCLAAAHENAVATVVGRIDEVCDPEDELERRGSAIAATLTLLYGEPAIAALLGNQPVAAVAAIARTREQLIGHLATLLLGDRRSGGRPEHVEGRARFVVAATIACLDGWLRLRLEPGGLASELDAIVDACLRSGGPEQEVRD
jgi:AcrR family transcriptional regulator